MHHPFHILESLTLFGLMLGAEMHHLAQSAAPDLESLIGPLMQSFGIPGAWLAVIAYTLRKLINAHVARQQSMATCQEKLTDSTIEIQRTNLEKLTAIEQALPNFCHAKPPVKPTPPES